MDLKISNSDGVLSVVIDRPERRNALSVNAFNELSRVWDTVDADESVQAVILTSSDCGTFCAGMDLKEAAQIKATYNRDILELIDDPFQRRMRDVRKPIIAAMTGHFTAGGMMLALNSDIRIGLAGTKGGITESKIGRGSPWAVPLVWMLPQPVLMEMTLTAELVSIERLHQLGFVNHVMATSNEVRAKANEIAAMICRNAPLSVRAGKHSILHAMSVGCDQGLIDASTIYQSVYHSLDAQEGPKAFAEKRAPLWRGR